MNKVTTIEFRGFESLIDVDESLLDLIESIVPSPEYKGTIKVTVEYIPDPTEGETKG